MGTQTGPWNPQAFSEYPRWYPQTPPLPALTVDQDVTPAFVEAWHQVAQETVMRSLAARLGTQTRVLLVRGYLGNLMPGNFHGPRRWLRGHGVSAALVRNHAGGTVEENAALLIPQARAAVLRGERLLFLTHSKGGLEVLWALKDAPELVPHTVAVVLAQAPRGPSVVMESLLLRQHQDSLKGWNRRAAEAMQRAGLYAIRAHRGGEQLLNQPLRQVLRVLDAAPPPVPMLQMVSWSSTPTTWLDSFHQRLGEVRPGCAHDGQFFLEDLFWPRLPHVLLGHVDHAQPALGGHGFDHRRYWGAVLHLLHTRGTF